MPCIGGEPRQDPLRLRLPELLRFDPLSLSGSFETIQMHLGSDAWSQGLGDLATRSRYGGDGIASIDMASTRDVDRPCR